MPSAGAFYDLVGRAASATPDAPFVPTLAELRALTDGLGRAFLDVVEFDRLNCHPALRARGTPPPVPPDLREQFLGGGPERLTADELVRLASTPEWQAELWDELDAPTEYWIQRIERHAAAASASGPAQVTAGCPSPRTGPRGEPDGQRPVEPVSTTRGVWISLPLAAGTDRGRTVSLRIEPVNPDPTAGNWVQMIVTVSRSAREQYLDVYVTPTPGHAHSVAAVWVKFGDTPTRVLVGLCRNPHTGDDIGSVNLTALGAGDADAPVTAVNKAGATPLDGTELGPEDAAEVERMAAANLEERAVFDRLLSAWRAAEGQPPPGADSV